MIREIQDLYITLDLLIIITPERLFKILSMQKVNYLYHVGSLSDIKSPNSVSKNLFPK